MVRAQTHARCRRHRCQRWATLLHMLELPLEVSPFQSSQQPVSYFLVACPSLMQKRPMDSSHGCRKFSHGRRQVCEKSTMTQHPRRRRSFCGGHSRQSTVRRPLRNQIHSGQREILTVVSIKRSQCLTP